jgi:hypothetical protein
MGTTTDHAAEIRAAYKRLGWNSRKISVRSDYFSMGSAIRITIKSPEVDAKRAEEIAKGAERNRYVTVTYSRECEEILSRRWVEQLRDALARIPEGDHTRIEPIDGAEDAGVCRERQYDAQIWIDGRAAIHFNPDNEAGLQSGAFHLATLLQEQ